MKLRDIIIRTLRNLLKNKSRSILTIIAAAIGTASIIIMISVSVSIEERVVNRFIESTNILNIRVAAPGISGNIEGESIKNVEIIRKLNGVKSSAVIATVEYEGEVSDLGKKIKPTIVAMDMETLKNTSHLLKQGKGINDFSEVLVSNNFLDKEPFQLGTEYKISVFDYSSIKNKIDIPIYIKGVFKEDKPYLVTNILKDESNNYPPIIYMPIERVDELKNKNFFIKVRTINVEVKDIDSIESVLQQLKEQNFQVDSPYEKIKDVKKTFFILKVILSILGAITLIISSIGTANTINMSVIERRKEVGIIKAIGTKISTIKRLFFMEAFFIGTLGALLGIGISFVFSFIINTIFRKNIPYEIFKLNNLSIIPFRILLLVSLITITISVLASASAVNNAVKVDTLTVLREE